MQGLGETFGRVTIEAMAFGLPVSIQLVLGLIASCSVKSCFFFQRIQIIKSTPLKRSCMRILCSFALLADPVMLTMIKPATNCKTKALPLKILCKTDHVYLLI